MPVIDVQLHETSLLEAQVIINMKHLTELLRSVIDSNNTHDHEISELKAMLAAERERGDRLEKLVEGEASKRNASQKQKTIGDLDTELSNLADQLEGLRRSTDRDRHESNLALLNRIDTIEKEQRQMGDTVERESKENAKHTAKTTEKLTFIEKRLDTIVVPDVKPLEVLCNDYKAFKDAHMGDVIASGHFLKCWNADAARMAALCGGNSNGNGAGASSSGADGSANGGSDKTGFSQKDRTDYLLSLPPFGDCCAQWKACDEFQKAAVDAKFAQFGFVDGSSGPNKNRMLAGLNGANGTDATRGHLAQLAAEVKTQQQAAKNALDFLDRRMKDSESLAKRVASLEENARALGLQKADLGLVNNKADNDKLAMLMRQVGEVRDDVNEIIDRLSKGGAGAGAADGQPFGTSRSLAASDDLKRRVAELEVEAARLESKKADRTELQRFYQFLESVDPEAVRRKAFPNTPNGGNKSNFPLPMITSASNNNLTPHRPHTSGGNSSTPARAGNNSPARSGSVLAGAGGGGSPRGVFLGRSVAVVRDISGGSTPATIGGAY